ncbi:MAG: UDP-3-O-(3-hydroxymyristoyl)glucosamine N-acyltransferase [Dysgonamonadaceae bacterium]|jgi:UDP-3-O-[3-hydroxymyristoyl] glucosamine N-acyltransferase|nr:UDP-3-O-(3-hydroxymyristoyl)glucosamine N-acyltransferase [Dysgonamonadaceae bacterium]
MEFNAKQIAGVLNGEVDGNPDVTVNSFSKIEDGKPGTLTFLANPKYVNYIYTTQASIALVNVDFIPDPERKLPETLTLIRVQNAYSALSVLMNMVEQSVPRKSGIHPMAIICSPDSVPSEDCYIGAFAYIGENAKLGNRVMIYPQVYVGDNVTIGDDTVLYPGVKIYNGCSIGKRCIIHAGVVIGSDGFGFAPEGDILMKIPQLGNVVIEDDVEIGANTTVDRAVFDATVIRSGVKLDNLIQIAHNVEIGANTGIAAQTGISGSTKVGSNCRIGGQVGLGGHIKVGDRVNIGAQSGVLGNIKEGKAVIGSPPIEVKDFFRSSLLFRKLPDMSKTISQLQKEVEALKNKI